MSGLLRWIRQINSQLSVLAKKDSFLKAESKAKDVLLEEQSIKLDHIEKQVAKIEIGKNNLSSNDKLEPTPVSSKFVATRTDRTFTHKPFVPSKNVVQEARTKKKTFVDDLAQQAKMSQQNIYDSIMTKNLIINNLSKLSKLL